MRVLMISGDKNIEREGTSAHERFKLQAGVVEKLTLVVWPRDFFAPLFLRGPFDVVTSQDPFWRGLVALVAAKRLKVPLNVQLHADLSQQSIVKKIIAGMVLRRANSVRVVSEELQTRVVSMTSAPVFVLPVFIDAARFAQLEKVPHSTFKKVILWIGRFEDEKDPLLALETLRVVRGAGIDAGLVMLGKGSLESALRAKSIQLGLTKHVEFAGWQDPLPHLKKADVVLCTSRAESYGASIIEALAAGIPVVSPPVGVALKAGAIVAERAELPQKTIEVLHEGTKGKLQISLPTAQEWARQWKHTLQS